MHCSESCSSVHKHIEKRAELRPCPVMPSTAPVALFFIYEAFRVLSLWVFNQLFLPGSLWTFSQVGVNICMFEPGFGNCGCPFSSVIVPATNLIDFKKVVVVVMAGRAPSSPVRTSGFPAVPWTGPHATALLATGGSQVLVLLGGWDRSSLAAFYTVSSVDFVA